MRGTLVRGIILLFAGLFMALGLSVCMAAAVYAGTYAIVIGDRVNVRSHAEMDEDNRLFQVDRGQLVEIHGAFGDFFRSTVMGASDVYISREWVRIRQTQGTVTAHFAWVYDLPSEEGGSPISMVQEGDTVTVTSAFANWYGIELMDSVAFIGRAYVAIPCFVDDLPAARLGNTAADEVIALAKQYLGARYVWGGSGPNGFDCSGFIVYIMKPFGVSLNRHSADMARNGAPVDRNELERGDLVFFSANGSRRISHVGMYIGYGNFIHASSRATGVIISSLSTPFNSRNYVTARRVLSG